MGDTNFGLLFRGGRACELKGGDQIVPSLCTHALSEVYEEDVLESVLIDRRKRVFSPCSRAESYQALIRRLETAMPARPTANSARAPGSDTEVVLVMTLPPNTPSPPVSKNA